GSLTTTTTYTYGGITLLALSAARSDNATWTIAYLYGEDGRPYAGVYSGSDVASEVTFLIATTDRGDVAALTDTAGASFARYTYDPYGAVLSQATNATGAITAQLAGAIAARQPLRYAGYAYDAHSATYYLSQRHYDPATARFLTKDPARDDGEESAYQYCGGDPVGAVDPSGLHSYTSSLNMTADTLPRTPNPRHYDGPDISLELRSLRIASGTPNTLWVTLYHKWLGHWWSRGRVSFPVSTTATTRGAYWRNIGGGDNYFFFEQSPRRNVISNTVIMRDCDI
ncbi:MAG: RHS repeat-associated core domain-containing protein, partial [Actinomycetota bacterium]|nr:RHS repeat-associated core domain-containing protein [Actinomycetota bacterium]